MRHPIKVDVWSDISCPWCYIGKRNLETGVAALAEWPDAPAVEIEFHSFELAPDTPVDFAGSVRDFLMRRKGLTEEQVLQMHDHVAGVGRAIGLHYDFDAVQHTNTVRAHQVLHHAKAQGLQAEATERLMRAYFVEGRHIGRDQELADIAAEVGLDRDEVLRALETEAHLETVRADQRKAVAYGINGVPFFVIDRRYGISGAQPAEVFTRALIEVAAERSATPRP